MFDCLIHQIAKVFFSAHICTNKLSLGPECPEFLNQFLSFLITPTGQDNLIPLLCEIYCGGAFNTCQRARNENGFVFHVKSVPFYFVIVVSLVCMDQALPPKLK